MKKNLKAFSLVEIIVSIFILGIAILSIVLLKSQILDQKEELIIDYKMIYLSDYITKIIETKTPNNSSIWDKSYITISWQNIVYSSDIADKTSHINFFRDDREDFSYEHEIEYSQTQNLNWIDYYVFKITLKINEEEKIYYVTV